MEKISKLLPNLNVYLSKQGKNLSWIFHDVTKSPFSKAFRKYLQDYNLLLKRNYVLTFFLLSVLFFKISSFGFYGSYESAAIKLRKGRFFEALDKYLSLLAPLRLIEEEILTFKQAIYIGLSINLGLLTMVFVDGVLSALLRELKFFKMVVHFCLKVHFYTVYFFLIEIGTVVFTCQQDGRFSNLNSIGPEMTGCLSEKNGLIAISVIILITSIFFGGFLNGRSNNIFNSSKDRLSRYDSSLEFYIWLFASINCILNVLLVIEGNSLRILAAGINILIYSFLLKFTYRKQPFRNDSINDFHAGFFAAILFRAVIRFLALLASTNSNLINGFEAFTVIIVCPLAIKLTVNLMKKRRAFLLQVSENEFSEIQTVIKKCDMISKSLKKVNYSLNFDLTEGMELSIGGIFKEHLKNCNDPICFCNEFKTEPMIFSCWTPEKFSRFGTRLIALMYQKALQRFTVKNSKLVLFSALFHLKRLKSQKKAYLLIQTIREKEEFFSEEGIQADIINNSILKSISGNEKKERDFDETVCLKSNSINNDEFQRGKLNDILVCETIENEIYGLIQVKIDLLINFWNELYQDKPEMSRLDEISCDLSSTISFVEKIDKRLHSSNDHIVTLSERYRLFMGIFYYFIANNPRKACSFLSLFQSAERKMFFKKKEESFLGNIVILRVSIEEKKMGVILEASRNLERFFDISLENLFNQPIEILFTSLYADVHRQFLKEILSESEELVANSKRELLLYGKNSEGDCFPIILRYLFDFNEKFGLHLLTSLKIDEEYKGLDCIITDKDGFIDATTKNLKEWLAQNKHASIFDSCGVLQTIYTELNKNKKLKSSNEYKSSTLIKQTKSLDIKTNPDDNETSLEEKFEENVVKDLQNEGRILSFQPLRHLNEAAKKDDKKKNNTKDLYSRLPSTCLTNRRDYLVRLEEIKLQENNVIRILILKQINTTLSIDNRASDEKALESRTQNTNNQKEFVDCCENDGEGLKIKEQIFYGNDYEELLGIVEDENSEIFVRNEPNVEFSGRRRVEKTELDILDIQPELGESEAINELNNRGEPEKIKSPKQGEQEFENNNLDRSGSQEKIQVQAKPYLKHEKEKEPYSPSYNVDARKESNNENDSNYMLRKKLRDSIFLSFKEIEAMGNAESLNNSNEEASFMAGNFNSQFRIINEIFDIIYARKLSFNLKLFRGMILILMITFLVLISLNYYTTRSVFEKLLLYDRTLSYADYSAHNLVECQRLLQLIRGETYYKIIPTTIFMRYMIPDAKIINAQTMVPNIDGFFGNITKFDDIVGELDIDLHNSKQYEVELIRNDINGEKVVEITTLFKSLELMKTALMMVTNDVLSNIPSDDYMWFLPAENIPNSLLLAFEDLTSHLRRSLSELIETDSRTIKIVFAINLCSITLSGIFFLMIFYKTRQERESLANLLLTIDNFRIEKKLDSLHRLRASLIGIETKQNRSFPKQKIIHLKRSASRINGKKVGIRYIKQPDYSNYHIKWITFFFILLLVISPLLLCICLDFVSFENYFDLEVKMFRKISLMSQDKLLQKTIFAIFLDMVLNQSKSKVRNNDIEVEMIKGIQEVGKMEIFFENFMSGGVSDPDFSFLLSDKACELTVIFCNLSFGITNRGFFEARGIKIDLLNQAFSIWIDGDRSIETSKYLIDSLVFLNLIHLDYYEGITMEWFLKALRGRFNKDIEQSIEQYPKLLVLYIFVLVISVYFVYKFLFQKCQRKFFDSKITLGLINHDYIISNKIIVNYLKRNSDGKSVLNKIGK